MSKCTAVCKLLVQASCSLSRQYTETTNIPKHTTYPRLLVVAMIKECALSACTCASTARMCKIQIVWRCCLDTYTSMPVSYSTDLRWRAVWLVTLRNLTYDEAGEMLYMSGKSVQRYVTAFLTTGNVEPVKQRHGPECILSDFEQVIVTHRQAKYLYK